MNEGEKPKKKEIPQQAIDAAYEKMKKEIEAGGYHFNPDVDFTKSLIRGLLFNEYRYGYQSCPCRLAANNIEIDYDIVCPCDYRDPDLNDYDACFCGLFVSQKVLDGKAEVKSIPERRPENKMNSAYETQSAPAGNLKYAVWRCRVCGYICARDNPPERCPICKVGKERFERFM